MADKDTPLTSDGRPSVSNLEFGDGAAPAEDVLAGKVGLGEQVADRAGILAELFTFLWARKLWWMLPMVFILVIFGALLVFAATVPGGAFIYTLF